MEKLNEFVKNLKIYEERKEKPRIWNEKEILKGEIVDSFAFILNTRGCRWARQGGCTMCGYFKESYDASEEEIIEQVNFVLSRYREEKIVKIYTSGSFLDENELSYEMQNYVIKKFEKAGKIVIESRPEFINALENLKNENIEVAMGLESANNKVLEYSINKGFKFEEWRCSAEKVKEYGKSLRVYILIKPPFLSESDAIKDAIYSVEKIKDIADIISFNPVAIHSKTLVEILWKKGIYRPPWLWSVSKIINESKEIYDGIIRCDVVAGGTPRGAHNCGKCDTSFLREIRNFSLNQKMEEPSCDCKEEWLDYLELERFLI
ncbi:MAG: archaeosine biosynthesis radical SAM protein RaSEA [Thermoplasmatales archaeon]|nr:archaeosine biosynthesis radical SAM protein RaSEA [Thermoplasmatales archaeon]